MGGIKKINERERAIETLKATIEYLKHTGQDTEALEETLRKLEAKKGD